MLEDLQLRFTDNEISPWGGLTLLFKMLERCDMKAALAACPLPKQGSNRGYSPEQLIFDKFSQADNQRIFTNLYQWFFGKLCFDNYTLDFDSTVEQRCGEQEGAAKGYNPKRPGRQSHHPLLAFVADLRMIANFWLRPGNTSASTNFLSFLEDTLEKLHGKRVGLVRMDSGFFAGHTRIHQKKQGQESVVSGKITDSKKSLQRYMGSHR